ncbi:hypothetical protein MTR67_043402 [Solanum verrucosum]|uniref:Uncharacterized protein n=1 Tax=Solanum verrucosum TaxID=315347 RepID=A0AAF0UPC2_SOLVR|nr:hypothetical protein MTR67_043402 [Solanum verrucosum]
MEKQDSDPILLELKGAVHQQRVEVFPKGKMVCFATRVDYVCHDPSLGPRRDMANEEPEGTPNKPLKLVITLHRSRKYIQH